MYHFSTLVSSRVFVVHLLDPAWVDTTWMVTVFIIMIAIGRIHSAIVLLLLMEGNSSLRKNLSCPDMFCHYDPQTSR